ncbi:hypothetical protein QTP88_025962 [Uroleucon formosanum]
MIKDLEESCEMSKSLEVDSLQQLCTQYSYQAYNFLSEISSNKEHVMKIIDQPKNSYRSKRGLINLVGRVANVLFGVCDDTDAEYFYSKIRDLESSNSRISKSSDAQIQIMQSIISNVNSSLLEINKNEINLTDKYNFLLHEMQTEKAAIGTLNFKTALEERISLLNIILTQYAFETGNLLNIINMALQGFVHSSILDTNTFKNQLKNIKAQLPIGEGIPIDLDNSGISELLRLITTNIVYIENVLIFVIEIPLVNSYEFILYKNIPLPVNIYGNDYVMIAPKSDYIAIDKSRLYYLELSEIQISKCKQMMNMLLCTYDQQLHHLDESCELTVFRKPGILPNSCNLKNVNFNFSIWHRLDNTNSWIYVTIRDNIIIKCKNNSETIVVSINGTGILDLDNQCEANTDDGTLLIAKRKITTKMYKDFIPQLDTSINWKTKLDITNIILNNSIIPNKDKHLKNATSFASYTSPNVQNEIITICGNLIQENILKNIRNAKYFSILVDETKDVSRLEQMSFCVRYVDGVSNCIMEDFLEFSIVHDMTGKGLSTSILQLLEKFGLEKKFLVGQEVVPHTFYVHCASHSLNLAVGSSCKIVSIRNCIGTVSSVIIFFRALLQRTKTLIECINEYVPQSRTKTLIKKCKTRWVDRHESLIRFKLHKAIYYALKKLEECSNIETSRTAFQLSISINNSVFIIALHVIKKFFSLTLPLSIALQKVNIDLSYCYERVTDVCQIFKEIRENGDDEFKQIFSNSEESMLEGIIEVPRTVGRQTARNNIPSDSSKQY